MRTSKTAALPSCLPLKALPVLAMAILIKPGCRPICPPAALMRLPRCSLCCDLYTLVTGHMPAPEKAIRLSRMFLRLVIALALVFALTSNDIISYITKMISMIAPQVCSSAPCSAVSGRALTGRGR